MTPLSYRFFVVFHHEITPTYYHESIIEHCVFVNVNPANKSKYPCIKTINLFDFEHFTPLGKWYTESEVIYNVFKNPTLWNDVDFIGFLQYDVDSSALRHQTLLNILQTTEGIIFNPHTFEQDYHQKILMDESRPNLLQGKGINCYDVLFEDFNRAYDTHHKPQDWLENTIGLCSCFVVKKSIFENLMAFISPIIESKKLDKFDTQHQHRIQGGFLERYYAVWFLLKGLSLFSFSLPHEYAETQKQNTFFKRFVRRWKRFVSY